ncbi:hypothetical protein [Saccharothrix sp. ST-888]|uniref:hypothetical protein n=1 Tax=Saccharothrix sp. ST-888 TaxID=1427391 RepID=UPI0005EC7F3B|nr:hypothetical protein [Saccharothrix sp. ST-888]KJK57104.1 hypothetical protein UK12_18605 [Saccharothrix sp. ST-888]
MLAAGLAACGTVKELGAADKVSTAFEGLGDGKSLKVELSVDATPAELIAFNKAVDPGKPMEQQSAQAVAGLTFAFSLSSDKPLKDLDSFKKAKGSGDYNAMYSDPAFNFSYTLAGKDGKVYLDVRQVNAKMYAKLDVEGFLKLVGGEAPSIGELADSLPTDAKAAKDALAGKWISFDPRTMEQIGKGAGAGRGVLSPAPTPDARTTQELGKSVQGILSRRLAFEDKGTKDGADHIVVSAPARGLVEDLLKAFRPLAKDVPNLAGLPTAAPTGVPDRKLDLDLYLKDKALSSASFDLAQLSEKAGKDVHLPVKVAFGKDATAAQAPSGATEFTAADFQGVMTAVLMGGIGEAGGGVGHRPGAGAGTGSGSGSGSGSGEGGGTGGPSRATGSKLTDDQVKELAKAGGVSEETIRLMAESGLTYDDFKDMMES